MKPIPLLIAALSFTVGAAVTFLAMWAISIGSPELAFIVGAVLGSQIGAIMHHRQPGSQSTVAAKAMLGVVLSVCAIIVGLVLYLTKNPFKFAEISIPIAAVGSFVFPFVLFNTMWNTLSKNNSKSNAENA